MTPLALTVGSACSGSPWLRSQAAHSFSNGVTLPAIVARVPPLLVLDPGLALVLVPGSAPAAELAPELDPRLATCGELDPLLVQPASVRAASAKAAATARILRAPGRRRALLSALPFICSVSRLMRCWGTGVLNRRS